MDTKTRARTGLAIALGLATCVTVALALSLTYGLAAEYGGGSFASFAFWVLVAPPVLVATLAVSTLPRGSRRLRVAVVLATAVVAVGGGLAANAAGDEAKQDRVVQASRDFSCNGPNALMPVPAKVDRTWRELPRPALVYGPIEGSATHCTAGVVGDGNRTFADVTDAFRQLDDWRVQVDQPQRFEMVRAGVQVTVLLEGAPDQLTTIEVSTGS